MMQELKDLYDLPDVSYIDNMTLDDVQNQLIEDYMTRYKEIAGEDIVMMRADPYRLMLQSVGVLMYQTLLYVDRAGKQDLLKYSYGDYLENLAALKGLNRNNATYAATIIRFTSAAPQIDEDITIPQGTNVTNGDVYFSTNAAALIKAGSSYVDVSATCNTAGEAGNGYAPGEINALMDSIRYIGSAMNIVTTAGGAEEESDEDLARRIYLVPAGYSTAGPVDAYKYHALDYNPNISDVKITNPAPMEVDVRIIMKDGVLPTDGDIQGLQAHLRDNDIRPVTDHVTVAAPETVDYAINMKYFINQSDLNKVDTIKNEVNSAITEYINWQRGAIGRDINPSELTKLVINAGAKRVEIKSPVFTVINATSVAKLTAQTVTYGGVEND